jgi:hypothetical protein
MPGLGALGQFYLDHLDRCLGSCFLEPLGRKAAVLTAAAEVSGAHLPDQIAAMLEMEVGDAALPSVLVEAAEGCAAVERAHRIIAQRAKAHGRDVEQRGSIGE